MNKAILGALLGSTFALSACGPAEDPPVVEDTDSTMTGTEDDTSAAGAGVDTGAMPIGGGTGSATDAVTDAATEAPE